jgi:formate hydrogenlyase subunit 3/multisubunit Na+/H+ antiporter MnhD subunit
MGMIFFSLFAFMIGMVCAAFSGNTRIWRMAPFCAAAGGLTAAISGLEVLSGNATWDIIRSWQLPLGSLHMAMDSLSALFVLLIGLLGAMSAVYGIGYLGGAHSNAKLRISWCWYNLLLAAMLVVVLARDGFLFLVAWEIMTISSFFLVMFDHQKKGVMQAGWIYLVASHAGTAFLLVMFLLLSREGSLDFASLSASGHLRSVVFAVAMIGFGVKAGFVPLHVWLPEAHPAAPSHVSALMSGVMIKTGIYGILRVLMILGAPEAWWGWTLLVVGAASGILGVLFAIAQHDLKRLLAYHSVENIGIICLGLGIGVLGISLEHPVMALMGLCGGLMHVINHGIFKSLLFMGAGSVLHATGLRHLDKTGGLMKKMPVTGAAFLIGSAAISGLPPLNGFISEFLVYMAAFMGLSDGSGVWAGLIVAASLAMIGGLAAACFAKAFGVVFLGEPREKSATQAHDAPPAMLYPMVGLAIFCAGIGLAAPAMIRLILPAVVQILPPDMKAAFPEMIPGLLTRISLAALFLILLIACFTLIRRTLLARRSVRQTVTWDCGYAFPTSRMQYTASSFAQPIVAMFKLVLRPRNVLHEPRGLFPERADFHTHTDDIFIQRIFAPVVRFIGFLAHGFHRLQPGRTHLYIAYIVITILALLAWNLR